MSKLPPQTDPNDQEPRAAASCLDLLLIELVPLAYRITERLHARDQALTEQMQRSRIFNTNNNNDSTQRSRPNTTEPQPRPSGESAGLEVAGTEGGAAGNRDSTTTTTSAVSATGAGVSSKSSGESTGLEEELRDKIFWRLDNMGYRVGQGLAERFSTNKPRPQTPLDAIKFVCKDLWILVFRKPIDNLKTNHRGVFVLTDTRFQPLHRMSVDRRAGPRAFEEAMRKAQAYMYFPCGIIRGALAALGMDVTVTAESTELPMGTFHIKTRGAKP